MIYLFKTLPEKQIKDADWNPFREPEWIRKIYMYLVYLFQALLVLISVKCNVWNYFDVFTTVLIFGMVFIMHELLHIIVVCQAGDISLTYSGGIFLWLTPDAILSKFRYWLYMTCPFIFLTIIPQILSFFATDKVYEGMTLISWINAIIAGADIIDSILILTKPCKSEFWRGRYRIRQKSDHNGL